LCVCVSVCVCWCWCFPGFWCSVVFCVACGGWFEHWFIDGSLLLFHCFQAQQDSARERALRIQNAKKLEKAQSDYRVLQIRHDELVSRLALVADIERNGR